LQYGFLDIPFNELGCRWRSDAAVFFDATDISPKPSGRETSNPKRHGDEMSGILAAAAVARVAEAENADGKNTIFELENDLWSQSNECNDHKATAKV
jgi:hypothetical protein